MAKTLPDFLSCIIFLCQIAKYLSPISALCAGLAPPAPGLQTMAANDEASNGDDQQSGLKRKVAQNRR